MPRSVPDCDPLMDQSSFSHDLSSFQGLRYVDNAAKNSIPGAFKMYADPTAAFCAGAICQSAAVSRARAATQRSVRT